MPPARRSSPSRFRNTTTVRTRIVDDYVRTYLRVGYSRSFWDRRDLRVLDNAVHLESIHSVLIVLQHT